MGSCLRQNVRCDHEICDGALGQQDLNVVDTMKKAIEQPVDKDRNCVGHYEKRVQVLVDCAGMPESVSLSIKIAGRTMSYSGNL